MSFRSSGNILAMKRTNKKENTLSTLQTPQFVEITKYHRKGELFESLSTLLITTF